MVELMISSLSTKHLPPHSSTSNLPPGAMAPYSNNKEFLLRGTEAVGSLPEDEKDCNICYEPMVPHPGSIPNPPVPILNEFPTRINGCGHIFGWNCLYTHATGGSAHSHRCPMCRAELFAQKRALSIQDLLHQHEAYEMDIHDAMISLDYTRIARYRAIRRILMEAEPTSAVVQALSHGKEIRELVQEARQAHVQLRDVRVRIWEWVQEHGYQAELARVIEAAGPGLFQFVDSWAEIMPEGWADLD